MSQHNPALALLLGIGFFGCQTPEEAADAEAIDDGIELLDERQQLIRLSVDLRGRHPTQAELDSVDPDFGGDPRLYDDYVDYWLEEPEFIDRVMEVYNYRFLTRTGENYYDDWENVGLGDVSEEVIADAVANEPLKLLAHIVENDLPFSEMVLADYTMANDIVRDAWSLEFVEDDSSKNWRKATYTDGRPMAGILTMQTIWERYPSMGGNANRHRANAVSKMLLCDDYLVRPIVLNRSAVDQLIEDPEEAIATEGCQSCHATLDPLSAHFFGWFWLDDPMGVVDGTTYRPEWEMTWMDYSGKSPGYYGVPTGNMYELAELMAEDERFAKCATQTLFEGFTQRTIADGDWSEVATHLDTFKESGMNIKETVRSIVTSREYKAKRIEDPEAADRIATTKLVTPAQLANIISAKTGYKWEFDGREGLKVNDMGLQVLAGGIDSYYVVDPGYEATLGMVYIQKRLAQSAAYHVVTNDLDPEREGDAIMLEYVTADDTPESSYDRFDAQIRDLYLQVTGVPLADDATEPDELMRVWKEVYSVEGTETMAWTAVVSAVLRDPAVILY